MKTTYNTIESLETAIVNSTNVYKTKDLKNQLSWMKAKKAGKFITKSDLINYRNLIIFMINKSLFFKSPVNTKRVMQLLLEDAENGKMVFRTEKGIKGIICSNIFFICRDLCTDLIEKVEGREIWTNSNLRQNPNGTYAKMQSFYLNLNN